MDEITAKLQGMIVFTIVDFKKGYWMVVLLPDSRKLTCMALPSGRFQWTTLPMGTVVAQDIFQSKLDSIFIGMEGVTSFRIPSFTRDSISSLKADSRWIGTFLGAFCAGLCSGLR